IVVSQSSQKIGREPPRPGESPRAPASHSADHYSPSHPAPPDHAGTRTPAVRRRITSAISAAAAHSAPDAYQTTSYEPNVSRARPPRKATRAAPTWWEARTQPKTMALSSP